MASVLQIGTFGSSRTGKTGAMQVLIADKFEQSGIDGIAGLGAEVLYEPDLKDDPLAERVKASGVQVIVVRSTKVPREVMDGSAVKLVIRAGAGYNNIDVESATEFGIRVCNCPGKNSQAVAELAIGLMLAIDRKIPDNVSELREGRFDKKRFAKARGVFGRTIGLVGMGMIGRETAARARALGMKVLAYSSHFSAEEAARESIELVSLESLAEQSDVISVHVSLRAETRGMLGADFFDRMRDGAYFINTSRAEVVDQPALEKHLRSGRLWAGLDVFDEEPSVGEAPYSGSLRDCPNVYVTHHIGASTDQAQEAVADETVRIVKVFMDSGEAPNAVN